MFEIVRTMWIYDDSLSVLRLTMSICHYVLIENVDTVY